MLNYIVVSLGWIIRIVICGTRGADCIQVYEFAVRPRLMQNRLVTSALTFMIHLFAGFARYCSWIYGEVSLSPEDRYWCYPWIFTISRLYGKTMPDPRSCLLVPIAILPLLLIACYAHLCHVLWFYFLLSKEEQTGETTWRCVMTREDES